MAWLKSKGAASSGRPFSWPTFARQTKALVKKNLINLVLRRWLSSLILAVLLPVALTAVFLNLDNFNKPATVYGMGNPTAVQSLEQSLRSPAGGDLVFAFNSSMGADVAEVVRRVEEPLRPHLANRLVHVDNQDGVFQHCVSNFRGVSNCHAAVIFRDSPLTEGGRGNWSYTIRVDGSRSGGLSINVNNRDNPLDRVYLPLQVAINAAITDKSLDVHVWPFTTKSQEEFDSAQKIFSAQSLGNILSLALIVPLLFPVFHVVWVITTERRDGVSQLVDVMGGGAAARVASHVIAFNAMYMPSYIVGGLLYWHLFFDASNAAILLFWYIFTGVALINSSIFGAAFFKGPRVSGVIIAGCCVAVTAGGMMLKSEATSPLASDLPPYVAGLHIMSLLFPGSNFVVQLGIMVQSIENNRAIALASDYLEYSKYTYFTGESGGMERIQTNSPLIQLSVCWGFLALQIVGYPLLAIFVERLVHGISFTRRTFASDSEDGAAGPAIETSGLRKVYLPSIWRRIFCCGAKRGAKFTAVDGIDFVAQKAQILCLLGVNGAGKSTCLDLIGGLQKSTAGDVRINAPPTKLGVCTQRNVLFPTLTVAEHVRLWSEIKHGKESSEVISELIDKCDLTNKALTRAGDLSGGQKRKLQLACALAGESKVLLLDETTSGLDPISRRSIWNIILGERSKRSIVFTTHFLDEGEVLADHIVLMSKGKLVCQGSGAELKNQYGGGYVVHLPKPAGATELEGAPDMGVPMSVHQDRLQYHVPDSKAAAALIARLEQAGHSSGVAMTGPTIEDVFLRLTKDVDETLRKELGEVDAVTSAASSPTKLSPGRPISTWKQTLVLLRKRVTVLRRYWVAPLLALGLAAGLPSALRENLDTSHKPFGGFYKRPSCDPATEEGNERTSYYGYGWESRQSAYLYSDDPAMAARYGYTSWNDVVPFGPASLNGTLQPILRDISYDTGLFGAQDTSTAARAFHLVNTEDEFSSVVREHRLQERAGGLFVRESTATSTSALVAYPIDEIYGGTWARMAGIVQLNLLSAVTTAGANISVSTGPLTIVTFRRGEDGGESLMWVIFASLILTIYPVFFALYPAYERAHNIRELQYANGVRPFPVWMAHLLADFPVVLGVSVALVATIVGQFGQYGEAMWLAPGHIFVVSVLYGLSALLVGYLVARKARSQLGAFLITLLVLLVQFIAGVLGFTLLRSYLEPNEIQHATDSFAWGLGFFFPIVNVFKSFMIGLNTFRMACRDDAPIPYPGHIHGYGGPILLLLLQVIWLGLLLVWLESDNNFAALGAFVRRTSSKVTKRGHNAAAPLDGGEDGKIAKSSTDDAITKEAARVDVSRDDLLKICHTSKSFGPLVAVDDVSVGLGEGEILALLGPNGAGKTTLSKMIIGELRPDSGNVLVRGVDVAKDTRLAQRSLGVCMQFDALDLLTCRQHLEFYARVRGVEDVAGNVDAVLARTSLTPHASKRASQLSGGNKRKLSLGIALIGSPDVLILDEPSSHMDAAAKRVMWKTLSEISPGRSLLLISHSMEEADALATRAAIVSQRLLAIGTTQQLRDTYSSRYHVQLILRTAPVSTPAEMQAVEQWVLSKFPAAAFEGDSLGGQVKFTVPATTTTAAAAGSSRGSSNSDTAPVDVDHNNSKSTIGQTIEVLEAAKEELGLLDYSIGAPTLESVFLSVVRNNFVEEDGKKRRWWRKLFG